MIGASLSEPHTYRYYQKITVFMYTCVCVFVCTSSTCRMLMVVWSSRCELHPQYIAFSIISDYLLYHTGHIYLYQVHTYSGARRVNDLYQTAQ